MIKAVLFDCDGVLVDSLQNTIDFLSDTFRHFDIPISSLQILEKNYGHKLQDSLKLLLPQYPDEKLEEIYNYSAKLALPYAAKLKLFPHVIPVLKKLQEKHSLGLVTSRSKDTVEIILEKHNLYSYFITVIDREDINSHKPDPEGINKAIDELAIERQNVIYVGDTNIDSESAHNANIRSIIISKTGDKLGGDYVIKNIKELPSLIEKL